MIEGGHPHECGDLLSVELSQLGEIGQEGGRRDLPDTGHGSHELDLVLPVVMVADDFVDLAFVARIPKPLAKSRT